MTHAATARPKPRGRTLITCPCGWAVVAYDRDAWAEWHAHAAFWSSTVAPAGTAATVAGGGPELQQARPLSSRARPCPVGCGCRGTA